MPHISIVVPVYKGASCLEELYRRLVAALEPISPDFEIILVEDCGGDASWEIIQALGRRDRRVLGIQFSRNFGQHYGITAGMDQARGDWVVVMDGDLQDRPEEIPRLYAKAQEGYDMVLASRTERQHAAWKRLTAWLFYKVFNYLSGLHYDGRVGNFRIMNRVVADNFRRMREHLRFFGGLVTWMGFKSATVEVEHAERFAGQSTYTVGKLVRLATETILAYSDKPLWLTVTLGFVLASFAIVMGLAILLRALAYGSPVLGWPSLFVSLWFIGGIIIGLLGIIGVYVGKTFQETKKRPLYIIRETSNLAGMEKRIDAAVPADLHHL